MVTLFWSAASLWLVSELLFQNLDGKTRPFVVAVFITAASSICTLAYNEANASAWEIIGWSVLAGIFFAIASYIFHAAKPSGTSSNGGDEGSWCSGWNGDCDGGGDGGGD